MEPSKLLNHRDAQAVDSDGGSEHWEPKCPPAERNLPQSNQSYFPILLKFKSEKDEYGTSELDVWRQNYSLIFANQILGTHLMHRRTREGNLEFNVFTLEGNITYKISEIGALSLPSGLKAQVSSFNRPSTASISPSFLFGLPPSFARCALLLGWAWCFVDDWQTRTQVNSEGGRASDASRSPAKILAVPAASHPLPLAAGVPNATTL
jgi:hypothetical protein